MSNSLLATDYAGYHQIRSNPLADLVVSAIVLARNSNRWPGVKVGRFPLGVQLRPRNTAWRAEDIRALIEQPPGV